MKSNLILYIVIEIIFFLLIIYTNIFSLLCGIVMLSIVGPCIVIIIVFIIRLFKKQ